MIAKKTYRTYRTVCISLYCEAIDDLDAKVEYLNERRMTRASRSALIRIALKRLDPASVTREEMALALVAEVAS